jgi:hypothetical protein
MTDSRRIGVAATVRSPPENLKMRLSLTRYLMAVLCMLAAGTRMLPAGVIMIAARRADAIPLVYTTTGSTAEAETAAKLDRSAVGRAWSSVTGQSTASSLAVIPNTRGTGLHVAEIYSFIHSGDRDEVINSSQLMRLVAWDEEASIELFRLNADSSSEVEVGRTGYIDVRLAAGTLHTGGAATSRVFLALMLDAYLPLQQEDPPQFRATQLVPIETHKSIESARAVIDMGSELAEQFDFRPTESGEIVAARRSGSGGSGGLFCINNSWVGTNGVQCCANHAVYAASKAACWARMASGLLACLGDLFIRAGTIVVACVATAAVCAPFGGPKAFFICLGLCMGFGALGNMGVFYSCVGQRIFDLLACRADARAQYIRDLRDSGCWPPPEGYEP